MKKDTLLVSAGRDPAANFGFVNPPVYHASTVVFPTVAALEKSREDLFVGITYAMRGTPTTFALEEAVAALEGGLKTIAVCSGLAAITVPLLAFLEAGDHLLMTDNAYYPTRQFCDSTLKRHGVETTYYDPLVGAGLADLIRPNTRVVFTESPGSMTFEVQDIPAIVAAAHAADVLVMMDNTWASPLYFRPLERGVDISIQAGTKYIGGHADLMIGFATVADDAHFRAVKGTTMELGVCVAPDDCYLALRGLRTMGLRLSQHHQSGLRIARWMAERPEVARVMHPALPDDPGHGIWRRDFAGACGLFGGVLRESPRVATDAFFDTLELFGLGYSWGGYESLIVPTDPARFRTATEWREPGRAFRVHVGLEDPVDLIADLEQGFAAMAAAS